MQPLAANSTANFKATCRRGHIHASIAKDQPTKHRARKVVRRRELRAVRAGEEMQMPPLSLNDKQLERDEHDPIPGLELIAIYHCDCWE